MKPYQRLQLIFSFWLIFTLRRFRDLGPELIDDRADDLEGVSAALQEAAHPACKRIAIPRPSIFAQRSARQSPRAFRLIAGQGIIERLGGDVGVDAFASQFIAQRANAARPVR